MNILHISDLHLEKEEPDVPIKLGDKIDEVLGDLGKEFYPDVLLVTGDFTNTGNPLEFDTAKKVLKDFKNYESLKNIKNSVLVPGNHDYIWFDNGKPVTETQKIVNYMNFTNNTFFGKCEVENQALKDELDINMIQYSYMELESSNKAVLLIGMNSMLIDNSERKGQGFFSIPQTRLVKRLIDYYKNLHGRELVTLVAFHHHIIPVSVVERATYEDPSKFSLTLDARRMINFCLDNNILFALHGHQHQPSVVTWKDNIRHDDRELTIVSSGSISAPRESLGDISKNSFMLYSINESQFLIRQFSNSEENWDSFKLDRIVECEIDVTGHKYSESKCDVRINASAPKGLEMQDYSVEEDKSNLYYLYLNVIDCRDACSAIEKFTKQYNTKRRKRKVVICGLHHLYGKFDILLKYRYDGEADQFKKKLFEYLIENNKIYKKAASYFMNVSFERLYYQETKSIPILKSTEDYLNSTWNMATLLVETGKKLPPNSFLSELEKKIDEFDRINNTKIEDIIRNYVVGQDQQIIFELFISCYQFPMLTRFTNMIEEIVKEFGADKSTHIIYHYDEREI